MKKILLLAIALVVPAIAMTLIPAKTAGQKGKLFRAENPIANHYIVVLSEDTQLYAKNDTDSNIEELTNVYGGKPDKIFRDSVKGYSVEMTPEQASILSQDPLVAFVEEDGIFYTTGSQPAATWGIDRTDQRVLPLDGNYDYTTTGATVHAYVIDTGIRTTHAEFGGRAAMNYNAIRDGNGEGDCNGHGTHVAGTIGGSTFGVAKNVSLHGVRVMNCYGSGTISDIVDGVDWVSRHHIKPAVANMSLGGGMSVTLDAAVNKSIDKGVTYVLAAGNGNQDSCVVSPARIRNAITVGATDSNDVRTYFSNYGTCVDMFAPGMNITSAWNTGDNIVNTISGTSMAAPHVAGVAALYLESNPTATPGTVDAILKASATENVVIDPRGTANLLLYSLLPEASTCAGNLYAGSINYPDQVNYHNSSAGFRSAGGTFAGTLTSPDGSQFSLVLEKKQGARWTSVMSSLSDQRVGMNGSSGTYRWRVSSSGTGGEYTLCSVTP